MLLATAGSSAVSRSRIRADVDLEHHHGICGQLQRLHVQQRRERVLLQSVVDVLPDVVVVQQRLQLLLHSVPVVLHVLFGFIPDARADVDHGHHHGIRQQLQRLHVQQRRERVLLHPVVDVLQHIVIVQLGLQLLLRLVPDRLLVVLRRHHVCHARTGAVQLREQLQRLHFVVGSQRVLLHAVEFVLLDAIRLLQRLLRHVLRRLPERLPRWEPDDQQQQRLHNELSDVWRQQLRALHEFRQLQRVLLPQHRPLLQHELVGSVRLRHYVHRRRLLRLQPGERPSGGRLGGGVPVGRLVGFDCVRAVHERQRLQPLLLPLVQPLLRLVQRRFPRRVQQNRGV